MKALQYKAFGGLDVLEKVEVPKPEPQAGEILIKVSAFALNPMDWLLMEHEEMAPAFGIKLPQIFAYDYAGRVEAIGAGISDFKPGERVFGTTYEGAAADYILSKPDRGIFHTADGISDEVASTLGVAAMTAAATLNAIDLKADDSVLIGGAAGGVGVFAVQLAKLAGATVYGTASDDTADFLAQYGAKQVRYGEGLKERVKSLGITAATDLHSHEVVHTALELGVPAHKISTIIMFPPTPEGVSQVGGSAATTEDMTKILDYLLAGKMSVPIAATFAFDNFRAAIELQKGRHTHGKIVVTI